MSDAVDYLARIATLHEELGIPADYARRRGLVLHFESDENILVPIASLDAGRTLRLLPATANAWQRLSNDAFAAGIALIPLSGFRSVVRQTEIIRAKLAAGRALTDILSLIAAPGYSEHHTGRALDLGAHGIPPLEENFEHTAEFAWLVRHAGSYGFHLTYPRGNRHGIGYEPWHWCWRA